MFRADSPEELKSKQIYDYADVRAEIESEKPNPRDFTDVFDSADINRDLRRLADYQRRPDYVSEKFLRESTIQEYSTAMEIGEMDWFQEDVRRAELFPDGKGAQTAVFLTSEFDDHVNHIDAICVTDNVYTDFQPVPFALDITYNTSTEALNRKFAWRHHYSNIAAPGICFAKYFEDTFNDPPLIPKGKISAMPRFVIGFNPELSNRLTECRMTTDGWGSLERERLSAEASFCVLKELVKESGDMLEYLDGRKEEGVYLQQLHTQMAGIHAFFQSALETARAHDQNDLEDYSRHDAVAENILSRNLAKG